jgi:hypothetical protein
MVVGRIKKMRETTMADQQKPIKLKSDGIVSKNTIKKVRDTVKEAGQEATFNLLQQVEPAFFNYLVEKINQDKDKLRQRGVTGKQLQLIGDIMLTYGIDGFMQHRTAVSLYDSAKLNDIYGQDYEAWENDLLDKYLAEKKKKAELAGSEPEKPKLNIEPEKDKRHPGDLLDGSELG